MDKSSGRDDRYASSHSGWVDRGQERNHGNRSDPAHHEGRPGHRNSSARKKDVYPGDSRSSSASSTPSRHGHYAPGQSNATPHRQGNAPSNQSASRRSSTHSVQPAPRFKQHNQSQPRDFLAGEKSLQTAHPKSNNQSNVAGVNARTSARVKRPTSLQDVQPMVHLDKQSSSSKYSTLPSKRSSLPPGTISGQFNSTQGQRSEVRGHGSHHDRQPKHYKRSISAPHGNNMHGNDAATQRQHDLKYSTLQGQRSHGGSTSSSNIRYNTLQASRRSLQTIITEQPVSENIDFENMRSPSHRIPPKPLLATPTKQAHQSKPLDRMEEISLDIEEEETDRVVNYALTHSALDKPRHKVQLGFPSAPFKTIPLIFRRNGCVSCLSVFSLILCSCVLFLPFLLALLFLLPLSYLLKRVFDCVFFCPYWRHCCACCCRDHFSGTESVWIGSKIHSTMVAQSLLIVEHGLDLHRIRDLIHARLIQAENRRGQRLYPRFRQKAAPFCCGYSWVNDPDFLISNHVFNMPNHIQTLDDLQEYTSEMACKGLPMDHPLWEIQVLVNYGQHLDTVLLFRMHPCMTDGISLVRILEQALVDTHSVHPADLNFAGTSTCLQSFKAFFLGPVTFFRKYLCLKRDFNLLHGRHIHPSGQTVVAWSEPFSLSAATRIKQVARCTLNELFVSIAAANMRHYMQVSGISNPYNMHCAIPTDFHTDQSSVRMGNNYAFVVLPLPTNSEGAIPRLWETKLTMEKFKSSPEAAVVRGAMWFTHSLLPKSSCQRLWRDIYKKCSCVISNLVGPKTVVKLASREIKCIIYWLPPLEDIAVSISFVTYGEQIRMAVVSDRSVLPNPELLTSDFFYQLETLSQLLANRRIPGEQIHRKMENTQLLSSYTLKDLTIDQMQLQMTLLQQEIHDIKQQLDASSCHRISHSETHLIQRIESLKEQFREIMVELRQKRAEENEAAVIVADDVALEEENDVEKPQKPFRRRTLSMSSRMSTASVSSTVRPLSTTTSNQPSPTQPFLPSWSDLEVHDIERALQSTSKSGYKKHRLSTMDEYELDDTITETEEKRYQTY